MKKINNNQQGIVHHIGIFILVLVVFGALGFAGFRVWQNREAAKAATWDQIAYNDMNPGELRVYACKVDANLAKVFIKNTSGYTLSLSTGLGNQTIEPNSESGPFTSKWTGSISWNNITSVMYSLDDTVAVKSSC